MPAKRALQYPTARYQDDTEVRTKVRRFRRSQHPPGINQILRLRHSQKLRESLGAPSTRNDPQLRLGQPDLRHVVP